MSYSKINQIDRKKHVEKLKTLQLGRKRSDATKEKIRLAVLKQHAEGRCKGGIEAIERRKAEKEKRMAAGKKPEQCEICGAFGRICFDHDHNTDKFRGWICWRCNAVLGLVKDSADLLEALKKYIQKHHDK
jgi:hypothetical protein